MKPFVLCRPVFFILLLGLSGSVFTGPATAAETKYVWKAATLAPKRVGWANQVENLILPYISKVSDGNLSVKIYWGGIMGDDEDVIRKMHHGLLDVSGFAGEGAVLACPEMAVLELPFLFETWEEVDHIRKHFRDEFQELALKRNFVAQVWIDQDFDQIYSTDAPMNNLEDFSNARLVSWNGALEERLLKRLGATPVPAPVPEMARIVKSGAAQGLIGPALWVVGTQLYSSVKFMNPIKIRYSPAVIMNTRKSWESVPAEYTRRFREKSAEVEREFVLQTRKDNQEAIQAMREYGVLLLASSAKQTRELRARTLSLWQEMSGQLYPESLLKRILQMLADFRAANRE